MKIEHANGTSIDTDTLPDVDAILMEESRKLHALFAQYNRQLLLVGEMKAAEGRTAQSGCVFFHICSPSMQNSAEEFGKAMNMFYARTDGYIRSMSNGQLGIVRIPPPIVESYPEPSES
jgi:hypothetical protein